MTDQRKSPPRPSGKARPPPSPKPDKPDPPPGHNARLNEQTRKRLGKHYANRYHTRRG